MGFWSLSALVVCAALPSYSQPQPPRPEKQQSQTKKQETGTRNATGASEFGSVSQITTVTKEQRPQDEAKDWYGWFWPPAWSNWALVAIGGIAALAAFRTLAFIRRQTNIMNRQTTVLERQTAAIEQQVASSQMSAQAARRSADAAKALTC